MRDTPWGYISYLDYKKNRIWFKRIQRNREYARKLELYGLLPAWDINSQNFLKRFKCKFNKIASSMLTNL